MGKIDVRVLMTFGFSVLAFSCWLFASINTEIAIRNVAWPNIIAGFAMGFVFVPVTTASVASLPNEQMGNATGIFNLMRNIGGSFGISLATTLVARSAQAHQAMIVGHLTPYDPQYQHYLHMLTGALRTTAIRRSRCGRRTRPSAASCCNRRFSGVMSIPSAS